MMLGGERGRMQEGGRIKSWGREKGRSHLVSSDEDGAIVRVEEEGGEGLGEQWLTAMATLKAQLVMDVPHTQLLWMCESVRG